MAVVPNQDLYPDTGTLSSDYASVDGTGYYLRLVGLRLSNGELVIEWEDKRSGSTAFPKWDMAVTIGGETVYSNSKEGARTFYYPFDVTTQSWSVGDAVRVSYSEDDTADESLSVSATIPQPRTEGDGDGGGDGIDENDGGDDPNGDDGAGGDGDSDVRNRVLNAMDPVIAPIVMSTGVTRSQAAVGVVAVTAAAAMTVIQS